MFFFDETNFIWFHIITRRARAIQGKGSKTTEREPKGLSKYKNQFERRKDSERGEFKRRPININWRLDMGFEKKEGIGKKKKRE